MEITQSYARPSTTTLRPDGLGFEMATENSRPPVALQALIRHSLSYARVMLSLYEVVSSNFKFERKDTTAYQTWVQERYLEELEATMGEKMRGIPAIQQELEGVRESLQPLKKERDQLFTALNPPFYTEPGAIIGNGCIRKTKRCGGFSIRLFRFIPMR